MIKTNIYINVYNLSFDIYKYIGTNDANTILFQSTFDETSEGVTEFIGVVHALMYIKKNKIEADVHTKNEYIKQCVESRDYKHQPRGIKAKQQLGRCRYWLSEQKQQFTIQLIKQTNG